ncbi:MerC mercury resistance protein [Roseimaritima multifibrata]|uniref:MerC mercury resistance protein n=1 Tax=Roseimaritima multifibrata TaxID=1930274 RepID=A0A517MA28_9BACT|nr:MerC domain-containing protein [Roseimaritima multifibrata]QDS91742.1 MerC mercury resistance protein [Roseimaritima multifibrata]
MLETIEPNSIVSRISASKSEAMSRWQDWVGIVASIGCAIHCAAMPFVIAFLPAFGVSFLADEGFHRVMAIACFVIAIAAFVPGFRHHRRWMPGSIAVAGLSMITVAAFGFSDDCCVACESPAATNLTVAACTDTCCEHAAADTVTDTDTQTLSGENTHIAASFFSSTYLTGLTPWITPIGGMLLVSAHLLNHRYRCACGCCETPTDQ